MNARRLKLAVIVVSALSIAGCAGPRGTVETAAETSSATDAGLPTIAGCLDKMTTGDLSSVYKLANVGVERLDAFLACYVGPEVDDPKQVVASVKLLRAHIAVAVISRYAAFNVTGEVGDLINLDFRRVAQMPRIANSLIDDFTVVENGIRIDSKLFSDAPNPSGEFDEFPTVKSTYDALERFVRVMDSVESLSEATKPTQIRGREAILNLINVASVPSPTNVRAALNNAKTALLKLAVIDHFGHAYRIDARNWLTCVQVRETTGKAPAGGICKAKLADDWRAWDTLIDGACKRLDKIGNKTGQSCLPFKTYK